MNDILIEVKELAFEGKSYYEIKDYLEKSNFSEDVIKNALKRADEHIVEFQLASHERSKVLYQLIIGAILFFIGSAITLITFFSNRSHYILAWGAILAGAVLFSGNYKKYKEPIEYFIPRNCMFRKRF